MIQFRARHFVSKTRKAFIVPICNEYVGEFTAVVRSFGAKRYVPGEHFFFCLRAGTFGFGACELVLETSM